MDPVTEPDTATVTVGRETLVKRPVLAACTRCVKVPEHWAVPFPGKGSPKLSVAVALLGGLLPVP